MNAHLTAPPDTTLQALGAQVRASRKTLRVSATATAEAAGLSRVTLHRIEKGEPSVAMGAWVQVMAVLGLRMTALGGNSTPPPPVAEGWIPVRIPLADFPQLKALAWQVQGTDHLTPVEALDIYERNARHMDLATLTAPERALLHSLQAGFGRSHLTHGAQGV
jgi:DNA-binding XRE family transcriptional regulator